MSLGREFLETKWDIFDLCFANISVEHRAQNLTPSFSIRSQRILEFSYHPYLPVLRSIFDGDGSRHVTAPAQQLARAESKSWSTASAHVSWASQRLQLTARKSWWASASSSVRSWPAAPAHVSWAGHQFQLTWTELVTSSSSRERELVDQLQLPELNWSCHMPRRET